mgnify:CR=1 FL=1
MRKLAFLLGVVPALLGSSGNVGSSVESLSSVARPEVGVKRVYPSSESQYPVVERENLDESYSVSNDTVEVDLTEGGEILFDFPEDYLDYEYLSINIEGELNTNAEGYSESDIFTDLVDVIDATNVHLSPSEADFVRYSNIYPYGVIDYVWHSEHEWVFTFRTDKLSLYKGIYVNPRAMVSGEEYTENGVFPDLQITTSAINVPPFKNHSEKIIQFNEDLSKGYNFGETISHIVDEEFANTYYDIVEIKLKEQFPLAPIFDDGLNTVIDEAGIQFIVFDLKTQYGSTWTYGASLNYMDLSGPVVELIPGNSFDFKSDEIMTVSLIEAELSEVTSVVYKYDGEVITDKVIFDGEHVGKHVLTVEAEDDSDNLTVKNFDLYVTDGIAPELSTVDEEGSLSDTLTIGSPLADVITKPMFLKNFKAVDDVDGDLTSSIKVEGDFLGTEP